MFSFLVFRCGISQFFGTPSTRNLTALTKILVDREPLRDQPKYSRSVEQIAGLPDGPFGKPPLL
jgi:hypothetical protein